MDAGLKDACVLITGASGGIGQAAAKAFSREGARLALHCFSRPNAIEDLQKGIATQSVSLQSDLRDEAAVAAMFADAIAALGRVDHLVVNAGIWNPHAVPLYEMSLQQWRETIETDLTGAFLTCRGFLRHLAETRRESASIVLVGSTAALFGEADHADYAAAKAAMTYGLTRSLKNEIVRLAPRGRVNCVCPGWTDTPMAAMYTSDESAVRRATTTMALKKIATAEDVARAIVFLSSESLAGHISGTILPVAGGMEGRLLHSPEC